LAESWEWTDPLTLVFKLRKGIKFQNKPPVNGREFTADDVTYCWNRILTSPRVAKKRYEALESVSKVDKYTVAFKLNSFVGEWRYMFGYGAYNAL
jgi:peptide/nickel transport system substrate-binding protein